jgi:hypothetical protein
MPCFCAHYVRSRGTSCKENSRIPYSRPKDGSKPLIGVLSYVGLKGLMGRQRAKRSFKNGHRIVQVTAAKPAKREPCLGGVFSRLLRLQRADIEKEVFGRRFSGHYRISLRAVAVPASADCSSISGRNPALTFQERSAVPYIPALKGEVLRHDG